MIDLLNEKTDFNATSCRYSRWIAACRYDQRTERIVTTVLIVVQNGKTVRKPVINSVVAASTRTETTKLHEP
jgi:uncharacterized protein YifN (PemK superfamily)